MVGKPPKISSGYQCMMIRMRISVLNLELMKIGDFLIS